MAPLLFLAFIILGIWMFYKLNVWWTQFLVWFNSLGLLKYGLLLFFAYAIYMVWPYIAALFKRLKPGA